ncbi:hypothetical protein K2173_010443 [Erythroxylum novogranatense]|uniref:PROP1-like PPR domain-containing protein n=1 Tax=Erythroxylum novogranatense TaxID=1862640 RepID=A0AAV8TDT6_9ROSI|nr:hypothetical protein K2173_010443 [Erythroxylum novogranatense]
MDLSFSVAKSQSLNLISCAHLSSSSAGMPLEFLGRAHNLRPPADGFRTKCRRLKLRERKSRNSSVNASLDSNAVLAAVVAVTTLSALPVAYFNLYLKKKNDGKEVLGFLCVDLTEFGRNVLNRVTGDWFVDVGLQVNENSVDKDNDLLDKATERSFAYEVREEVAQVQESLLVQNSSISLEPENSPDSCNNLVLEESEAPTVSTSVLSKSVGVVPLVFATGMPELASEVSEKETGFDSELPRLEKTVSVTASVERNHESGEKGDLSSYIGILKESIPEDLYTFYGESQSIFQSPSNLNGFKTISSLASTVKSNNVSLLKTDQVHRGEELSTEQSLKISEAKSLAHHGDSSPKHRNVGRSRKLTGKKDLRNHDQHSYTKRPQFPEPNGKHVNDKDHLQQAIIAYNRLLRNGRLSECVDLLEDMKKKDMLDMNKVYHTKFFQMCKTKSAVKEAFHFCKLVPNPTLSTFNMLMSVCASSKDSEGAFQVLRLAQGAGFQADCKLYTTLISTCAKSGRVDAMFEVFHQMVNAGVEPNIHTYGTLIDGCARAGQVAKAFGAYGIMRSKNVKPDRVVFNALITACGQSGAVDRAFDVLAEMQAETRPIDPDHITVGALIKACANAGQVNRAKEVYEMVHEYNIKGTPEVYTIAVNCCSQTGDWDFACSVYEDMKRKGVVPDEVFFSALIDVAGHAGKVDAAFQILQEAKIQEAQLGIVPYSSLMGACSNAKNWRKALELYEEIKARKLNPTVSTMNALITALCDGDQLPRAIEVLSDMKSFGLCPNCVTYSVLIVASERKDDLDMGLMLFSQAKADSVAPTLIICKCIIGMCSRRFEKASAAGEPILSFASGWPQIENKWTSLALMVYRELIASGQVPTMEAVSQVLGCLQLPRDASLKGRLIENLGVTAESTKSSKLLSLVDGFGEYDPRAFSLLEEAASLGIVPCVSFKESPIVVDAKKLQVHIAEVYLLTVLKGLKHRLAAGAKLPNVTIYLPIEKAQITTQEGERTINLAGRISQAVASLFRRLGLPYQGSESYGRIRINGISLRRWFQPKLASPFSGKPEELSTSQFRIGKGILDQQRNIRIQNLSLD